MRWDSKTYAPSSPLTGLQVLRQFESAHFVWLACPQFPPPITYSLNPDTLFFLIQVSDN